MGLADYQPERREVTSKGKVVISVRGLSFDDLSILIRAHMDGLNTLFDLSRNATEPLGTAVFFMDALQKAPGLLFDVIAIAADEPSYGENARKLTVGLQVQILQEITSLTLEDIGGPKSAVALVQKLLAAAK